MIKTTHKPVSFADYVHQSLRPFRVGIPVVMAVVAGITVAIFVLFFRAQSDSHLLRAIAPHLSTLVETQDRPELMRLLGSISKERQVDLVLVQTGQILASSRSESEIDTAYSPTPSILSFSSSFINFDSLVSSIPIVRPNGPDTGSIVLMFSPLYPILLNCLIIAIGVFLLSFLLIQIYAHRIMASVQKALFPIASLDAAISDIPSNRDLRAPLPLNIQELDHIQTTILETRRAFNDATDRLAEAKAKELLSDSYRQLIHDIYTPVAALREVIKVLHDPSTKTADEGTKINTRVARLAEQVLNQVSCAKETLSIDHQVLNQEDLRKCVSEATEQSILAFAKRDQVNVIQRLPENPVMVPHDPANLRRAVTNLVSNALRACERRVDVEVEVKDSLVAIRVSDDGKGVNQEDLRLLLHGRVQAQGADRPGYGLPSANHIARAHGGRIIYKTSSLGGACFEIRM